ncbi:Alcohol dehydrogenase [acceptor] [BD1-7 clade bacterium]|uniref:Alcohol dehydrogenase [acceptor] n=1 Tax=BD1-7 clade bacterium TaxID=2029982 RepID=A0A5S9NTB8_9GAMM|nr:Alcohol dehydrogenase [acceptor] [BD1-7 clade bacterium]CAA0093927.1 Alcohol dehydrogenase [acceptor] [BD1-7 clade bacterium]
MYDYIIIGGGSAGCVLANRLSADASNKVLLLEAGPKDNNPMIHMPGGCAEVLKSNKLNWKFESTPQKHLGGARYEIPRGKTLGGSSSSNGMVYIRGHATDYDDWAAQGNNGWAFNDVLPYFKRFENQTRGADDFHGVGGELNVINAPSDNPLYDMFVNAGQEAGYRACDDFNGANQEGVGRFQATIKDGKRWSSAAAFLTPVLDRPNLTVICDAHVTRVVLDGNKAVAVEYLKKKKPQRADANKEIVISAGTIKSPHILQLSGIGDTEELKAAGIESKIHLPGVGKNLQEHLDVIMRFSISEPLAMNGIDRFPKNVKVAWDYFVHKKGVGACNNIEGGGFIRSSDDLDRPDVQLHFVPVNMTGLTEPLPPQHGVTLHACNLRPKSRGTIKAVNNDPMAKPDVDFNFCDNEDDWQLMIKCVRVLRNIMSAKAWNGIITEEIQPGTQFETDEDLRKVMGQTTETVYHPVGTCKMGNGNDAVVDAELKVIGVEGLRVADASIIPTLIGGNTNAPSMMIGDKCSDMMLGKSANG